MPAQIGGALADIEAVHSRLTGAGVASEVHAGEVSGDVSQLQSEIESITTTLQRIFEQRADSLLAEISQATRTLESADWSGSSREAAASAELQLTGDVRATVETARGGIEALSLALRDQVGQFYAEVNGDFARVMAAIRDSYAELARGTDMFAQNLAEADRTITFS